MTPASLPLTSVYAVVPLHPLRSAHLIAHHHMDARGTLPIDAVDVLWGDAVQAGNLLSQLQCRQLFQEDGMVHCSGQSKCLLVRGH